MMPAAGKGCHSRKPVLTSPAMNDRPTPATPPPGLDDVRAAAARIRGRAVRTPLRLSTPLSDALGVRVHHKIESMQHTGAFKLRGAFNALLSLDEAARQKGVICVSTGNHGRGVAFAARELGIKAAVCMSELVPSVKVEAIRALDADVRIGGASQDEAERRMMAMIEDEGLTYVSPFDDAAVIAGQGTIGLEIFEDLAEVRTCLVPLSGGGLIAGVAVALKALKPDVRLIGVTMENGAAMVESLKAGQPVQVEEVESLADSLGGGIGLDNRHTFRLCRDLVDETVLVSEEEIADAMAWLYWQDRLVTEGGAAVGVAALRSGRVKDLDGPVANVVTGANVEMQVFTNIVTERRP